MQRDVRSPLVEDMRKTVVEGSIWLDLDSF